MSSRFVRRVRTASGAVAVQLVVKDHGEVVAIEHIGSAHTDAELALLLAAAQDRLHPGQQSLDLGELAVEPVRVGDTADWTRPEPDAGGRRRPGAPGHNLQVFPGESSAYRLFWSPEGLSSVPPGARQRGESSNG